MSCVAVSANRALGVLAVVWMLMAMRGMKSDAQAGTEGTSPEASQTRRSTLLRAYLEQPPDPCELGMSHEVLTPLCLATLQPNRKKARVKGMSGL